jgi:hypothetical protein
MTTITLWIGCGSTLYSLSGFGIDHQCHVRTTGNAARDRKDSHQREICSFHRTALMIRGGFLIPQQSAMDY